MLLRKLQIFSYIVKRKKFFSRLFFLFLFLIYSKYQTNRFRCISFFLIPPSHLLSSYDPLFPSHPYASSMDRAVFPFPYLQAIRVIQGINAKTDVGVERNAFLGLAHPSYVPRQFVTPNRATVSRDRQTDIHTHIHR